MSVRRSPARRRGQPLIALILLMISWVGARAALWEEPRIVPANASAKAAATKRVAPTPAAPRLAKPPQHKPPQVVPEPQPLAPPDAPHTEPAASGTAEPSAAPEPVVADAGGETQAPVRKRSLEDLAGHQELYSAAMALPTIDEGSASDVPRSQRLPFAAALAQPEGSRWSGDAWLLLREGGNGTPGGLAGVVVPAGFYGGSQAGAVLRFRLDRSSALQPTFYLRASSGLNQPRGEEVAAGFAVRPIASAPLSLMAEARVTNTAGGTIVRPAATVVTQLPPARLPLGVRGEAYAQAGYVGGRYSTAFVDGQARAEKPFVRAGRFELRAGGGVWGGAQRGASRLDIGPTATLSMPVGPAGARLSADYRIRIAGQAAPGSGAVVTLSAGF